MLEGFTFFALLCGSMFLASYVIGFLPLLGNLGQSKIRLISVFGAGLLIGTAFSVVVPEGIDALHGSVSKAAHAKIGDPLEHAIAKEARNTKGKDGDLDRPLPDALKESHPELAHSGHSHDGEHEETGRTIGICILAGFLFMFVIDQMSKSSLFGTRRKLSTTIGLCVHALADGVLMGSASSTKNSEVQMVVFFALIIHKGPSAFALSSLLLLENLERFRIKRHLLIFSLSAPFGAMITYFILSTAVAEGSDYSTHLSGLFMLFSAGTFVFVAAAHVLPELEQSNNGYDLCSQIPDQISSHGSSSLSLKELFILFCGALSPSVLLTHHHH